MKLQKTKPQTKEILEVIWRAWEVGVGGAVKENNEGRERNRGNVKFVEHNSRSILPGGFEESQRAGLGTVPL